MKIELPHVGESVTEGIIGQWLKEIGERVEKYDPLVEIVTDKVNMELPSPASGVLTAILAEEGETVPMGGVIAEMRVDGEEGSPDVEQRTSAAAEAIIPDAVDRTGTLIKDAAPVGPTGSGRTAAAAQAPAPEGAARRYSPAVQQLAKERRVDLARVRGTGIGGRVTRRDVQAFIDSKTDAPPEVAGDRPREERIPLTPVRRIIADNMVRSAAQIPHAWSMVEADVTGLVLLREMAKADFRSREGVNLTYLPFAVKAAAESLKENPLLSSSWGGDAIVVRRAINIGVAVAGAEGLVVPVVRDADSLGVSELARAIDGLVHKARSGQLALEDVQGGTFTLNNTGALGSVAGYPLIVPGQAAIMTTEAVVKRPVVTAEGEIAARSMMNLCLSFDHRIVDGAEAGAFLASVKVRLEAIGPDTAVQG